jgi:hypothetical protein
MSLETKHKIIAATVAAVALTSTYLVVGSGTQIQEKKDLTIEVSNKPIEETTPVSTIAPAVSADSPASPVSATPTAESEGCPGVTDPNIITAHAWFTLSDADKPATKAVLDGNCNIRQVVNGELATYPKLVVPFGSLFDLYAKGIETKDSGLLKAISEQAVPKNKSVEAFVKMYEVAPPQGWDMAQKISTLINVPDFILKLREAKIATEKESMSGRGNGQHGFTSNIEGAPIYLSNPLTHEPSANFMMIFTYLALGGNVDLAGMCLDENMRNPGDTNAGAFYYSDKDAGTYRTLNLILQSEQIGQKVVKKDGQTMNVAFIQCKKDRIS